MKSVYGGVRDSTTLNIDNTERWRGAAEEGRRNRRLEVEVNLKLMDFF